MIGKIIVENVSLEDLFSWMAHSSVGWHSAASFHLVCDNFIEASLYYFEWFTEYLKTLEPTLTDQEIQDRFGCGVSCGLSELTEIDESVKPTVYQFIIRGICKSIDGKKELHEAKMDS